MEREMPPPPTLTLPDTTRQHITQYRTQKTATIQPSLIITKPPPATSTSPVSPPKKKSRMQSPSAPANKKKNRTRYDSFDFSYPVHEKYDLQEVYNIRMMNSDTVIVKAPTSPTTRWDDQHWSSSFLHVQAQRQRQEMGHGERTHQQVLRREHIRAHREEAGKGHTAGEHHFMVRLPRTSLRGPWRTDTTLPAGQKGLDRRVLSRRHLSALTYLEWGHSKVSEDTLSGEDTLSAPGWGHPLGSWMRTPFLLLGEDTLLAPGWGHPPCTLSGARSMTCG